MRTTFVALAVALAAAAVNAAPAPAPQEVTVTITDIVDTTTTIWEGEPTPGNEALVDTPSIEAAAVTPLPPPPSPIVLHPQNHLILLIMQQ